MSVTPPAYPAESRSKSAGLMTSEGRRTDVVRSGAAMAISSHGTAVIGTIVSRQISHVSGRT